jgi:hypothetical protein
VLADVIRSTSTVGEVARVAPDQMGVPRSVALDVAAFPRTRPSVLATIDSPVLCVREASDGDAATRRMSIIAGAPAPSQVRPLAGADGAGPAVDAVGVPGGGVVVAARGRGTATRGAVATIVSDTGVRFDVPDTDTAAMLGLGGTPVPVDGGILDRLPAGPRLDRASALVSRDGSELHAVEDDAPTG